MALPWRTAQLHTLSPYNWCHCSCTCSHAPFLHQQQFKLFAIRKDDSLSLVVLDGLGARSKSVDLLRGYQFLLSKPVRLCTLEASFRTLKSHWICGHLCGFNSGEPSKGEGNAWVDAQRPEHTRIHPLSCEHRLWGEQESKDTDHRQPTSSSEANKH